MRSLTFGLGAAAVVLTVLTARWYSQAHGLAGRNQRLEREIAQVSRERDMRRAEVERLRQPLAIRTRVQDLTRSGGRFKPEKGNVKAVDSKIQSVAGLQGSGGARGARFTLPSKSVKVSGGKGVNRGALVRTASPNVKSIPVARKGDA